MRGLVNYEDSDPESGDEVSVSTLNVAPDVPIEDVTAVAVLNKGAVSQLEYAELTKPAQGAAYPLRNEQPKNTFTGYAQPLQMNPDAFEEQRRAFHSQGYAVHPDMHHLAGTHLNQPEIYVGDQKKAAELGGTAAIHSMVKAKKKMGTAGNTGKKRAARGDPGDLDRWRGPWAGFEGEEGTSSEAVNEEAAMTEKEIEALKKQRRVNLEALPLRKKRGT